MAKLIDLIAGLSDVLGLPHTTVETYAKELRRAGLVSSGGRGTGGALMTPRDAARLLCSVMDGRPSNATSIVDTREEFIDRVVNWITKGGTPEFISYSQDDVKGDLRRGAVITRQTITVLRELVGAT